MMEENPIEDIKKITPNENQDEGGEAGVKPQEEETLIPKIEPDKGFEKPSQKKFLGIKKPSFNFKFKANKKVLAIVFAFFVLIALPFVFVFMSAKSFYKEGMAFAETVKTQDLVAMRGALPSLTASQKKLATSYKFISWTKFIPFVGGFVADGGYSLKAAGYGLEAAGLVLDVVEPYADLLGLEGGANVLGEATTGGEKTTQERIDFIVKTVPDLIPQIDTISQKMSLANAEVEKINPSRYPLVFFGRSVRPKIKSAINLSAQAEKLVNNVKPILTQVDYLLGINEKRTYLVLFQNDKELRPTGGFMTAYSIMNVENARFEPVISSDIYSLDTPYEPVVPAPDPIVSYLKGPYIKDQDLRLRDMNWNPDFAESMDLFTKEAEKVGIDEIDGVIAVDTQLLVYLLDAIGKVGVSGFGEYSTEIVPECNCPQVIYELESFADVEGPIIWDPLTGEIILRPPNSDNRKKIIGPLMNSIMANTLGQPKEKLPAIFEAGFKSLFEKHILFYLFDEKAQEAVSTFGIGGRVSDYDGDYLLINDANLGGRKSNLYVTEEVDQEIEIGKDGSVTKTVTITYKNPEKHDGWLNSVLPNWVRIYVPKGSELLDVSGLSEKEEPYEELGKTVFAGYFELRPEGVNKVTVTYKLPMKFKGDYSLFIQKQPGKHLPLYIVREGKSQEEFFLRADKEIKLHL